MNYSELRQKQEERMNNFSGLFFAFSNEQLEKGLSEHGLTMAKEDLKKVVHLGCGTFLLRDRREAFDSMLASNKAELEELKADKRRLIDALIYELNNHEYCYTSDPTDALEALGLTEDTVPSEVLRQATQQCHQGEY